MPKKSTGRIVPPLPSMLQDELSVYEAKMILGRHENTNWKPWNQPSTAQEAQGKQALRLRYSYIANWLMRKAPPLTPGNRLLIIKPCQDFVMWLQVLESSNHSSSSQSKGPAVSCSPSLQHVLHILSHAVLDSSTEETTG